jgi:LPS-assembly lipoprotein
MALRGLAMLAVLALLSACGFRPLYGGANGQMSDTLATIYVEPMPDKVGYELRNKMIDLLDGPGTPAGARYHLKLSLTTSTQGIALQNAASPGQSTVVTRYNDTLTVTYALIDTAGKTVLSGTETALSAYNVLPSGPQANYGTLAAQQDAERRAAEDIAQRILFDLNVHFTKR